MKKTILIMSLCVVNMTFAQNVNQSETSLNNKNKKNSIYKEHKKQLMEINKKYQEENKNSNSDKLNKNNTESLFFSNDKLIKK